MEASLPGWPSYVALPGNSPSIENYVMLCYVIQLTPRWGFSAADYIK